MKRTAISLLQKWKNKPHRKPLIIHGARQVGKTWLMKEFGKTSCTETAYINFDTNERMKELFRGNLDIPRLVRGLEIESGVTIHPETTLLVFDEIQEVPEALASLKYFNEIAPEYPIIAAGSLLGLALHPGTSFPVGKVDILRLYPLSFREFLMACGETDLADILEKNDFEMMNVFSGRFEDELKRYLFVGGMPEAVARYSETRRLSDARAIQKNLLMQYVADFSKHAPTSAVQRVNQVWNSIPAQLAKENRKFVFGLIRDGARARDYELSLQWLRDCGLIHLVNRISAPKIPLAAYRETDAFKVYSLDVGLLAAMGDIDEKTLLEGNGMFVEFKGALTEQFVAQQLIAVNGLEPGYYSADNSRGEIDFVIQKNGDVIPIEAKAAENLRAKSLRAYCDKFAPPMAVRTSLSHYREESWMKNVPLYALAEWLELDGQ